MRYRGTCGERADYQHDYYEYDLHTYLFALTLFVSTMVMRLAAARAGT